MDALTDRRQLTEPTASREPDEPRPSRLGDSWRRWLSPRRIGAVYVWTLIIVVFGVAKPDIFLAGQTASGIADSYAIAGIAALALLVPLSAGVFDVSIGATMSLVSVVVAQLLLSTSIPIWVVVLLGLAVGLAVGVVNSIIVVILKVPSLIGTLAVLGIADALAIGVSGNATLSGPRLSGSFNTGLVHDVVSNYQLPVLYVLVLMLVLGIMLERTQFGRFLYAVGFNAPAARLAGLRVQVLQSASLMIGGVIAAGAGIVLTAQLSSSTPSAGDSYLLPAFAAVFLGSTQFRAPRFNAWGTVIAVYMLATGEYGLLLSGAPSWTPQVFQGVALIAAVALTRVSSSRGFGAQSRTAA
jgi:ribose transport system permease protein